MLLGIGGFSIPWLTLFISIVLFIVIPLVFAVITRLIIIKKKGKEYLEEKVIKKLDPFTSVGLLVMLVLLFTMQSAVIIDNPLHILLIAIQLVLQTLLIFMVSALGSKLLKLPYDIAAPANFVGTSNFFELAVAVAIALFPLNPGVSLATVVGVLVEVPVMLMLVKVTNRYRSKMVIDIRNIIN